MRLDIHDHRPMLRQNWDGYYEINPAASAASNSNHTDVMAQSEETEAILGPVELLILIQNLNTWIEGYITPKGTRFYGYHFPHDLTLWLGYSDYEDDIANVHKGIKKVSEHYKSEQLLALDERVFTTPVSMVLEPESDIRVIRVGLKPKNDTIQMNNHSREDKRYLGIFTNQGCEIDFEAPGMKDILMSLIAMNAYLDDTLQDDAVLVKIHNDYLRFKRENDEREAMMYR